MFKPLIIAAFALFTPMEAAAQIQNLFNRTERVEENCVVHIDLPNGDRLSMVAIDGRIRIPEPIQEEMNVGITSIAQLISQQHPYRTTVERNEIVLWEAR